MADVTDTSFPNNIEDVAQLILKYGFLDVDFSALSSRYQIPVPTLAAAAEGSLFRAVGVAMDLALETIQWPIYDSDWKKYLEINSLALWDFFAANPGYARLMANGIMGVLPAVVLKDFVLHLVKLGVPKDTIPMIFSSCLLMALNDWNSGEGFLTQSGNIALISTEFRDNFVEYRANYYDFVDTISQNIVESRPLHPPVEFADFSEIVSTVAKLFFVSNAELLRDSYIMRLRIALAGLEKRIPVPSNYQLRWTSPLLP